MNNSMNSHIIRAVTPHEYVRGMRLVHTSDWHLGRSFGAHSLLEEQAKVLDWLFDFSVAEGAELLVIAGDLHDRAIPPVEAVELLSTTFQRFVDAGVKVVAIAGNHDSPHRLAANSDLMEAGGVLLRGGYRRAADVARWEFSDGPLALAPIPYLLPQLLPTDVAAWVDEAAVRAPAPDLDPTPEHTPAFETSGQQLSLLDVGDPGPASSSRSLDEGADTSAGTHAQGAGAGTGSELRRRTHERILRAHLDLTAGRCAQLAPRSLSIAHAFVTGAAPSDSERELAVGTAGMVSAEGFAPFSYSALGHLHRPQSIGETGRVHYSGSPLPYSFSEADVPKQVNLVDMSPTGACSVDPVEIGVGRRVRTVRGTLDELLGAPAATADTNHWTRVELISDLPVPDARFRLSQRFAHIVEVNRRATPEGLRSQRRKPAPGSTLSDTELVRDFWMDTTGSLATAEIYDTLTSALDDLVTAEVSS